ncbi:MAG: hypothetical protein ACRD1Z_17060, partial [Vicinamibacteria bacterium]
MRILFLLASAALLAATAYAQETPAEPEAKAKPPALRPVTAEEKFSDSSGSVRIDGVDVRYRATAGQIVLHDANGKPRANVFFVAYTRDGEPDPRARPITFAYNGGPGSASVWLHMGTLGPNRVQMAEEGFQPEPPFRLVP